jgi:aspartate/methionine/tyrosine aminotransferase
MQFDTFLLERNQSLYENEVEINLTESGVHALTPRELLTPDEQNELLDLSLGYGHTEGTPAARDAVARWHPGATRNNVLLTTGTSEANLVSLLSGVDPGDEIIVIVPNFMQLAGAARAFGMTVKTVPLVEEAGWSLDRKALKAALSRKTRLITACNPNNPTGMLMSEDDRAFLVEAAESKGAWLLVDEIYRGAELQGRPETATFWGKSDHVIVTGGLAKSFAQAGLRIGWVIAPELFIQECMRRQDYTTIGTNAVGQYLCAKLLEDDRRSELFARNRRVLDTNLAIVRDWIEARPRGIQLALPQAGGMAFAGYPQSMPSNDFSRLLREQESVFVVAGEWFGLEGRIRIGFGGDAAVLKEGLARLGRFMDGLSVKTGT